MKDLLCLVADKNIEAAVRGLLTRPRALAIRDITFDVHVHPRRDPGCFHEAPAYFRPFLDQYRHALVALDRAWDGAPLQSALELDADLRGRLGGDGWSDAVVIDPEIEAWVWSDSPHVDRCLGWEGRTPSLRDWLRHEVLLAPPAAKPNDPKEALERALRVVRIPRSSAIYEALARSVGVERCVDDSFARFRSLLCKWFSRGEPVC